MENSIFHRLSSLLWGLIVTLMVLLAIYVSLGRLLASNLGYYGEEILAELNRRVPFNVEAADVAGEWHSFTPRIVLSGLRVSMPGIAERPLELSKGRVGLDVLESLRTRSLKASQLELHGLSLSGELDEEGRFRLTGFAGGQGELGEWLKDFLLNIERLALTDNTLELTLPSSEARVFDLALELSRRGSQRYLDARLQSTRGADIRALGEGLGDPFDPETFQGKLYLDIDSSDLGAVRELFAQAPPVWAEGALDLEAWLSWERGAIGLESRVKASGLRVMPENQSWQIPLERVSLEARLVERRNRLTVFLSNVELDGGGEVARLPRLQVDMWGQAIRVRGEAIDLAPLNTLATGLDVTPPALADVFRTLSPRGALDSLQLYVGDLAAPGADWELEANFTGVHVDSWKGAPGVTSASGYVELADGGGFVILDSQPISLAFPTVYREPLAYDDLHGTIYIDWDELGLQLSSGLVSATAEEGDARVLFGLSVPFKASEVGIEMDLLVGLENTRPVYRAKYLPYILNPTLLEWLAGSVGEGSVERAGFIWRGSLRGKAGAMRTIQLALKIAETSLDYHPRWPAVDGIDGILLIDDTNVSVWSESARLYGSEVKQLSAEAWMGDSNQMMLAIDGSLQGSAADGLAVLNNSLLRDYVGDAFVDWQLDGRLHTHLKLEINLGNKAAPPQVDVLTGWRDVDVEIVPGKLPVRGVSGEFAYQTQRGFSSKELSGSLWGQPLAVEVHQAEGDPEEGLAPVEVAVETVVDMANIREWLELDLLRFTQGQSAVDVTVLIVPGDIPQLHARSTLAGVSLDLPPPWRVSAAEERALTFDMPLGGEQTELDFELEGGVRLALAMQEGALVGGALAFNESPASLETGRFRISGQASLVDVDAWDQFLANYLSAGFFDGLSRPEPAPAGLPDPSEPATATAPTAAAGSHLEGAAGGDLSLPTVAIEQLHADRLVVAGQALEQVLISLEELDTYWQLTAQTDWLQGDLFIASGAQTSRLELHTLDLVGLDQLDLSVEEGGEILRLPDLDITVADLRSEGNQLGQLGFELRSEGAELRAQNITGELADLRFDQSEPGQLRWVQGEGSSTTLDARLVFDDFGDTLAGFGYQRVLETDSGTLDLALNWPGAPQDYSLQTVGGSMLVNVGAGSFLEAPAGASGALRVVGILNLASIVQRLSLSHMFESGIPFDTVEGEVYLHGGTIEVSRLDVQGASSRFQFSGVSDTAARTMDGELVATLPVASNLPWVAALAGGLPVAAGVFVVSKVFEKQFDRLSSAVYSIEGNWDDPQVEFDRIWDDSADRVTTIRVADDPQQPVVVPGLPDLNIVLEVEERSDVKETQGADAAPASIGPIALDPQAVMDQP